jgi:hypothetical protein
LSFDIAQIASVPDSTVLLERLFVNRRPAGGRSRSRVHALAEAAAD